MISKTHEEFKDLAPGQCVRGAASPRPGSIDRGMASFNLAAGFSATAERG